MTIRQTPSEKHVIAVKVISLLSLVRWYNILLVFLAQYLASVYIINSPREWLNVILDYRLFLVAVSSALLIAGGYIINGFYDSEKDLINRPDVALFNQIVSKPFRLYCYFGFNLAGIFLSFLVSWEVLFFHVLFSFGLWFYSHKLKKITFVGNIAGTLLSIAAFFSISLYYHTITPFIILYVGFIFLVELTREIIKDMQAMKGDMIMGYNTLPVSYGMRNTTYVVVLLQLITISIPFFLYLVKGVSYIMLYFLFSAVLISISMLILLVSGEKANLNHANRIYKLILLAGIFSIVLF